MSRFYRTGAIAIVFLSVHLGASVEVWGQTGADVPPPADRATHSEVIPPRRVQSMMRGVNLQGWMWRPPDVLQYDDISKFVPVSDSDLAALRALGLTHVRLCIDPSVLVRLEHPDVLAPSALAALDQAVQRINAQGLLVIVDMHASDAIKKALGTDNKAVEHYATFWKTLAHHFSTSDPDRVVFEIINEPNHPDRYRWVGVQASILAAIRSVAPHHTVVVTGPTWSTLDELVDFMPLLADRNVIYTVHYYEPMPFTHQGANWVGDGYAALGNVPYPATMQQLQPLIDAVKDNQAAAGNLFSYGQGHWDAQRFNRNFARLAEWSRLHQVPVFVGEFGAYNYKSPPDSRDRWIHDIRSACDAQHIGWTMWDYDGGFGLFRRPAGGQTAATLDKGVAEALGLHNPDNASASAQQ